jgi:hypothetical protein
MACCSVTAAAPEIIGTGRFTVLVVPFLVTRTGIEERFIWPVAAPLMM